MATQDTTEDKSEETLDEKDLETTDTQQEDEALSEDEKEDDSEETEDSDEEEDSEDSDEEETEEDEPEFEKRFTQFKGDSYEEYVPNLEKAYGELLGEVTRVKQTAKEDAASMDVIRQAIEKDPDFAQKLDELLDGKTSTVTVDPAILKARQDLNDSVEKDFADFAAEHPELETDPIMQEKVYGTMERLTKLMKAEGKMPRAKEVLDQAWIINGYHKNDDREKTIAKAKESASKSKTGNKAKKTTPNSKDKFTAEQKAYAKKWGVTLE